MAQLIEVGDDVIEFPDDMPADQIEEAIASSMGASVAADTKPVRPDISTITGKPTALTPGQMTAGSELAVGAVRNIGVGASMLMDPTKAGAAVKMAGLIFGSELAAGEMEEMLSNPEYQSGMEGLKRQGEIVKDAAISGGVSYYGDRYLLPWLSQHANKLKNFTTRPIMKQTLGRLFKPKGGYTADVETSQRFLGRMYSKENPFGLTLDQLHQGQKTLVETAGSIARSSFGGGRIMRKTDMRNQASVDEFVTNFLKSATETTPRQFGNMMKGLLSKDKAYITHQTNQLFDEFREMAYGKGIEVNLGDAFSYLRENADNRFARGVLAKVMRSDPAVMNAIKGGDELLMKTPDELEAIVSAWPVEKIDEVLDSMANSLPIETAVDLYHNVNRMFRKSKEGGMKRFSTGFKKHLDGALEESLGGSNEFITAAAVQDMAGNVYTAPSHHLALDKLDEAKGVYNTDSANLFYTSKGRTIEREEAVRLTGERSEDAADIIGHQTGRAYAKFREANDFSARHGERIEQKIIETMFKKIGDNRPASIIGMFQGAQGADTLVAVKKFFTSSDVLNMQDFENTVRQPLRHWFLSQAVDKETGAISGRKLASTIDRMNSQNGPGFMREIFGPNAPEAMRDAATTLNLLSKAGESNILMKIIQASVLAGAATGIMYGMGQPIERVVGGGVAVLFTPYALAKIMANPKLTRVITDGFIAGPGTSKFARTMLVTANLNKEWFFKKNLSVEAREFYDKPWEMEEEPAQINWPVTERMLQPPPLS